ncbi:MAG: cell division protein ZapA [Gemmatimonadota bacterium]|nr:cell division protein ZapA [Gemmatimonadota bacterium]
MSKEAPRTSIRVEIAGEWYTLRADADEEYTRRCAALVDERMSAVSEQAGVTAKNAAILAALSLSDELLRQQSRVEDRLRALTARIEAELEGLD